MALTSSMSIVAMTTRIWPKMMSLACSLIICMFRPSKRSAAFSITPCSVDMPTVKVEGVLTRMFCLERAPVREMSIGMGVRSSHWKSCRTGQTKAAPPWTQWEERLPLVLP